MDNRSMFSHNPLKPGNRQMVPGEANYKPWIPLLSARKARDNRFHNTRRHYGPTRLTGNVHHKVLDLQIERPVNEFANEADRYQSKPRFLSRPWDNSLLREWWRAQPHPSRKIWSPPYHPYNPNKGFRHRPKKDTKCLQHNNHCFAL